MSEPTRERLLTPALLVFLLAVATTVGYAMWTRSPAPDLEGAVELLADGDLDGDERRRMLLRVLDLAQDAESPRGRWAGLLAAVALSDRGAFERFCPDSSGGSLPSLSADERQWLSLGDPLLANLLAAMLAEVEGDDVTARLEWQQVEAQARMTGNRYAGELGALALERLR